ncbi:glycosyltransferase [Oecophyllibacter saccharovorans]|nr:glycosyltransferase [Oecophyllibacter saccharovorans]
MGEALPGSARLKAQEREPLVPEPPVILQVLPALGHGGVEQGTLEIARALRQAGARALVASDGGPLLPPLRACGAEHIALDFRKSFSPLKICRQVQALRQLLRREGVQLVHARSRWPAWIAWAACCLEGVPLVTTWHGVHGARTFIKRFYNSGLVRGERVIAVSGEIGRRLVQEYHVPSERLRVIARGSDPERFDPAVFGVRGFGKEESPLAPAESAKKASAVARMVRLRQRWGLREGEIVLLLPARLTGWKGQALAVEALGRMARQWTCETPGAPWRCLLVGPGVQTAYGRQLQARINALGLAGRVQLVGACSDMPAAYALTDIVLAPSLRPEPFGRVAVEAQMMGCTVVASLHGGQAETVLEGKTGILLPPGHVRALASALAGLIARPFTREVHEAACAARQRAVTLYAMQRMQAMTLEVYDEVLGHNTDRDRLATRFRTVRNRAQEN